MFHRGSHAQPWMLSGLVHRYGRWREVRLGECSDRNGNDVGHRRKRVEDGRAAVGAEMKASLLALVGGSHVLGVATEDADVLRPEPGLDPEGASGSPLAGKTVAHGDPDRIALRCQMKLPTATGGITGGHRRDATGFDRCEIRVERSVDERGSTPGRGWLGAGAIGRPGPGPICPRSEPAFSLARADERAGFRRQAGPALACDFRDRDPFLHHLGRVRTPGLPSPESISSPTRFFGSFRINSRSL